MTRALTVNPQDPRIDLQRAEEVQRKLLPKHRPEQPHALLPELLPVQLRRHLRGHPLEYLPKRFLEHVLMLFLTHLHGPLPKRPIEHHPKPLPTPSPTEPPTAARDGHAQHGRRSRLLRRRRRRHPQHSESYAIRSILFSTRQSGARTLNRPFTRSFCLAQWESKWSNHQIQLVPVQRVGSCPRC